MGQQRLRAVVTGADIHAVRSEDLADVMRVHTVDREVHDADVLLRLIRAEDVYVRDGLHCGKTAGGELCLAALHHVKAYLIDILYRGLKPGSACGVDRTGLELMRKLGIHRALAGDGLDHLTAAHERRHLIEQRLLAV